MKKLNELGGKISKSKNWNLYPYIIIVFEKISDSIFGKILSTIWTWDANIIVIIIKFDLLKHLFNKINEDDSITTMFVFAKTNTSRWITSNPQYVNFSEIPKNEKIIKLKIRTMVFNKNTFITICITKHKETDNDSKEW